MLVVGMRSAEECYRKVRRDSAGVTPVVRRNARVELDREENRHSRAIPLSDARPVAEGPTVFAHACKMGLEGIVSKRKDSPYRSGPLAGLAQSQRIRRARR
jgi:ATP-dependent DNA ligase